MNDTIDVRAEFYGNLRDMTGRAVEVVQLPRGATVRDMLERLSAVYGPEFKRFLVDPQSGELWVHFSVALNNDLVGKGDLDQPLQPNDVIRFLYPITGGSPPRDNQEVRSE